MDKTPVYPYSFEYAFDHNETQQHIASNRANIACKEAIETAIDSHYLNNCLETKEAVREVVKQFGFERMFHVLANTIQSMDHDGRISSSNKSWARAIPIVFENNRRDVSYLITHNHPGLLNMFVSEARHQYLLKQPLKAADIKSEAARILEKFQTVKEPNSPSGRHYMAEISPDFLARAKTKDRDRLMAMLPFQSLIFSTLEGRRGTFALISGEENRFQKLVLRRPSVRQKLQEKSDAPAAPKSPGKKKSRGQER